MGPHRQSEQFLRSNVARVDLLISDYSIETEPEACMAPCGLIHEKRPVTQKRGHALMFEVGSGPGLIVWGPTGMTLGGGADLPLYCDKLSAHVPH